MPIFVSPNRKNESMDLIKNIICNIIEKNYKGTFVPYGGIELSGSHVILRVDGMKERNMPFAAKRILNKFPEIDLVHFTGGWVENIYTRNTLKWLNV